MTITSKITKIGIINTIRLNYHYFGISGLFFPIIIASRNLKILKLGGTVNINCKRKIGLIRIGYGEIGIVDSRNKSIWENEGEIIFNGRTLFGPATKIINKGKLSFGENCAITANSSIICNHCVNIGDAFLLSWECLIMDTDYHKIYDTITGKLLNEDRPIIIGNNVWIGCRTTVLKGSIIKDGTVVGSNSLVNRKLECGNSIYRNNCLLRNNINWENPNVT